MTTDKLFFNYIVLIKLDVFRYETIKLYPDNSKYFKVISQHSIIYIYNEDL